MGNGNSDMTMKVMQQIAMETHSTSAKVDQLGQMLNGMNNIMQNLTGLSMLLNCMQIAQLEFMDEGNKYEVMEEYQRLCKKYGVKPLTGDIVSEDRGEGENDG